MQLVLVRCLTGVKLIASVWVQWFGLQAEGPKLRARSSVMDDPQLRSLLPWQPLDADSLVEALEVLEAGAAVSLDFRYCNIRVGPELAAQLAMWLSFNVTLTSLDLGDNSIGDEGAAELAEMLEINATLRSLHLRNNKGRGAACVITRYALRLTPYS